MKDVKCCTQVTTTITFDAFEVVWLKDMLQNPMMIPEDEPYGIKNFREALFYILDKVTKGEFSNANNTKNR